MVIAAEARTDAAPVITGADVRSSTANGADGAPGPVGLLRCILTCRVPAAVYVRLCQAEMPLLETAATALEAGLASGLPRQTHGLVGQASGVDSEIAGKGRNGGSGRPPVRPLAVTVPAQTYAAVLGLARDAFGNDPRDAAGWLIARGLGLTLPLPVLPAGAGSSNSAASSSSASPVQAQSEADVPGLPQQASGRGPRSDLALAPTTPRRPPPAPPAAPVVDGAPSGEMLRRGREALGLSQRQLAAAAGLSRGLIAEIELGTRHPVVSRQRLAATLAALEAARAGEAPGVPPPEVAHP